MDAFPPRRSIPSRPQVDPEPVRFEPSARPNGGSRLLCHPPARLARRYEALVRRVAPAVERGLRPGVIANRVAPANRVVPARPLELEPWPTARSRLAHVLASIGPPGRGWVIVRSDVRDCYASIGRAATAAALAAVGEPRTTSALLGTLDRLREVGVRGLPVGPPASAVLANAVLAHGDRAIAETGVPHVRWVDDVVLFARSGAQARRALDAWRRALGERGLEAHEAKTAFDVSWDRPAAWSGSAGVRHRDVR